MNAAMMLSACVLFPLTCADVPPVGPAVAPALEPGFWFSLGSKAGGMNEGVAFGLCIAANFLFLFALEVVRGRLSKRLYANAATWGIFFILTAAGHLHAPNDASIYITVGAALQLLAITVLVSSRRVGPHFPLEFGVLISLALTWRVAVTVYDMGYLPNDETGDGCIQGIEAVTALIVSIGVIREVRKSEQKWKVVGLRLISTILCCSCFGYVFCGDKDYNGVIGLLADQTYAAATYMELAAWLFMLSFTMGSGHRQINPTWLLPSVIQAVCRTYFWWVSYRLGALKVDHPVLLQRFFPEVLMSVSAAMTTTLVGMTVFTNADFMKSQSLFGGEKLQAV